MAGFLKEKCTFLTASVGMCLFFGLCLDAGAQKKTAKQKKQAAQTAEDLNSSAEPDKVLYDRAQLDLRHSRYTEGRLALQTLINTYPDSEYLAKAKLAIADSYFKEGGTSNLMQSISEYKDFDTFFPFLEEAAYAQMQIGMAHYKMMEKSDRDNAQAQMAEDELQAMLLKYPQSALAPQAAQRLREVQEIIADGEFKVARFYYSKQDTHAAGARLIELTDRYPLFSQSDEALWILGEIYTKTKLVTKDEDMRNVWAGQAAKCYARIAQDYPLSKHAPEAKARLKAMGAPVPAADPNAMARMQKEQEYSKQHHSTVSALLNSPMGMLKTGPDVRTAAHAGQPNLNPPNDSVSATEVLKPKAGGPGMSVGAGTVGSGSESNMPVDATSSGSSRGSSAQGMNTGVQIISQGESGGAAPASPAPPSTATATAPATQPQPPAASAPAGSSSQTPDSSSQATGQATESSSQNPTPAAGAATSNGQSTSQSDDDQKESTSKKKKGMRKLVPW